MLLVIRSFYDATEKVKRKAGEKFKPSTDARKKELIKSGFVKAVTAEKKAAKPNVAKKKK